MASSQGAPDVRYASSIAFPLDLTSPKTQSSTARLAALLALIVVLWAVTGCGDAGPSPVVKGRAESFVRTAIRSAGRAPFRFFSSTSFWNRSLPADAPLDPSSAAMVGALNEVIARERLAGKGPGINTVSYSVPIYTVPANQPLVAVALVNGSVEKGWGAPALQSAWDAVPLPANAEPAAGTDKHLVVWQPSTDRLWEFLQMEDSGVGWHAFWGGAIQNVSSDSGAYGPEAWPGSKPRWGASASSLSIAGGLITLEDFELGQINHALAMAIPDPRAGVYAAPAQRTDGKSTDPLSLPEGAHLRLDPNLNLASLHLPPVTLKIAEAAQRYGIVVRDTASHVTLYAQDPTPTGTDPYLGPNGYFERRSPIQLLASFPWSHLQVLKMSLRPIRSKHHKKHKR